MHQARGRLKKHLGVVDNRRLWMELYLVEQFVSGSDHSSSVPNVHNLKVLVQLPNHTDCEPAEQRNIGLMQTRACFF